MVNYLDIIGQSILQMVIEIAVFLILVVICSFIQKKIKNSSNRFLNPTEFLPQDEIHTLKQVFYLILMACFFINVLYSLIFTGSEIFYFAIYDIFISLVAVLLLDKTSLKNTVLVFFLVPYGALTYLIFGTALVSILDLIHIPIFIYLIKFAYDKFREYTQNNGLGYTIILLFSIIFISFFITQVVEKVNPLDSLVMVSNAFTSNGYSVLGHSIPGKINSLFLVWGGYIISGAATAGLTAAILLRYFNTRIKKLEKIIKEGAENNE